MRKSKILEKFIESQEKEIERLHFLVKDLNDKLIVMAGKAEMYELKTDTEPNPEMNAINLMTGHLDEMPAVTDEQKQQKAEAKEQLHEVLNH